MQTLDPDLRRRLLFHHRELGESDSNRRLTDDILDRYDGLVYAHFTLRQIIRHEEKREEKKDCDDNKIPRYNWPYRPLPNPNGITTVAAKQNGNHAHSQQDPRPCQPSPFDRLENATPDLERPQEALDLVDDAINEVIARYMPDFYFVHERWSQDQQVEETGAANRTYGSFFRTIESGKGKISGLFLFIVITTLVGMLTIPFLLRDQKPGDFTGRQPPAKVIADK